ncbi:transcriptional regulator, AlpA family [Pseudomonas linyingensis]|uniref:Transcriptional regulator, AlpA family n=1 Tax=Pseudomonas linyingensis TaxID=915471 RepID=A0A1H7ALJ5_9PSED|nr:AlpA family transcriptional regulator [Pseudomonas linyingensis]SEJ66248.1 transcriptional regulator, AlpA family [Pseudomonas linyingensis]
MKFLRLNDVQALTGLGRSTIYKYVKLGIFPDAVKLGGSISAWVESEVQAWMAERIKERDQQAISATE